LEEIGISFESECEFVEDSDILLHCYDKVISALNRVFKINRFLDIYVDYTGGTKNMSAALALAAVGRGARFSYVGGERRNKN